MEDTALNAEEVVTTNRDAWNTVDRYRDELNANGRKIALGGAALAWSLQKNGDFPQLIGASLLFFVMFFSSDLIQLFVGYFVRRSHTRQLEATNFTKYGEQSLKADYRFRQNIEDWPYRWAKLKWVLLCFAFALLLWHLWSIVDPLAPLWNLLSDSNSTP